MLSNNNYDILSQAIILFLYSVSSFCSDKNNTKIIEQTKERSFNLFDIQVPVLSLYQSSIHSNGFCAQNVNTRFVLRTPRKYFVYCADFSQKNLINYYKTGANSYVICDFVYALPVPWTLNRPVQSLILIEDAEETRLSCC